MLGRIPLALPWESQRSALAGAGFDAQLLLSEKLASDLFLSHICKLGIGYSAPLGVRVEFVHLMDSV